ncbi:mechanosensitive ion channel family protein [Ornithobacterium rhinotracheale]|uniref:mechanosensitive ion channel family protein n=1 Tax=Ornithobacterium rhinotracheale TaxID=28251 RepID=UPI00129D07AA|nr:mechanosensitive ion channel family protein [Ornithobacterium rhinotracheale]MRJ09196.1 mechanosensitive ion channel family protein [Ornithobacterium rhinotracheale]UOH76999.1 mechanosensitive ion channel family protein [Ornithobacterium rhinotracheale]
MSIFLQTTNFTDQTEKSIDFVKGSVQDHYHNFLSNLPSIFVGILIIILGYLLAKIITSFYQKRFLKKANDPLMAKFLSRTVQLVLFLISAMLALEVAGLKSVASTILGAAGGIALILGFAFQDIGKNFLAGIILAFNRPFNINDSIQIDSHFGSVQAMNFRYTHIKTSDGRDIFIPNSDVLTKPVENYTIDGFYRMDFIVGIGYEDDIDQAKEIIQKILDEHPNVMKTSTHKSFVIEDELAASAVNLKVLFWVATKDYKVAANVLRGRIIREVKNQLVAANINLPADIRELKLYGTEKNLAIKIEQDITNP